MEDVERFLVLSTRGCRGSGDGGTTGSGGGGDVAYIVGKVGGVIVVGLARKTEIAPRGAGGLMAGDGRRQGGTAARGEGTMSCE